MKMAWNRIQWQNPPIFNPCLKAAELVMGNVLVLPNQWHSGAAGTRPVLTDSHCSRSTLQMSRIWRSRTLPSKHQAREGLNTKSQTGGIPEAFACLFCVWTSGSASGPAHCQKLWNRRSLLWSLLTKWCLSRSANCICYGIYSISYVLKWRNLRLAQGSLWILICS